MRTEGVTGPEVFREDIRRAVRILTAVVSTMVPLTLIATIFGMNFRTLPGLERDHAWELVLVVMVVVGAGILLALRKRLRL